MVVLYDSGVTEAEATVSNTITQDSVHSFPFSPSASGNADQITVFVKDASSPFILGIYNDANPDTLLNSSGTVTPTAGQDNVVSFPATALNSANTYHMAVLTGGNVGLGHKLENLTWERGAATFAGGFPNTLPTEQGGTNLGPIRIVIEETTVLPTIENPPTEIRRDTNFQLETTFATTAPTTTNSSATLGGQSIGAPSTVQSLGSNRYRLTFQVANSVALKYSETGYPIILTIDSNASPASANIPLRVPAGRVSRDLINPEIVQEWSLAQGLQSGPDVANNFQVETHDNVGGQSITLLVNGDFRLPNKPPATVAFSRWLINASGERAGPGVFTLSSSGEIDNGPVLSTPYPDVTLNLGDTINIDGDARWSGATRLEYNFLPEGAVVSGLDITGTATNRFSQLVEVTAYNDNAAPPNVTVTYFEFIVIGTSVIKNQGTYNALEGVNTLNITQNGSYRFTMPGGSTMAIAGTFGGATVQRTLPGSTHPLDGDITADTDFETQVSDNVFVVTGATGTTNITIVANLIK